jgi:chemotaxis protein methyltransferase CheR
VSEYAQFCAGVRGLCGIDLLQYKRGQMERRIRTHVERRGVDGGLDRFLRVLEDSPEELDRFLDRVTINVSQLWRNPQQWAVLERDVLPELAEKGRLRIWSAGSSYGAEAYTLAAICVDAIPAARVEITGTDIDERMVARAREGVFSADDARDAPASMLDRHFERVDDGSWTASDRLRRMTRFEVGDLLRIEPHPGSYDLVLCRNTVIYFTEEVRDALHARLARSLRPGGYLVVGATERVSEQRELSLELTHPFTYRKNG